MKMWSGRFRAPLDPEFERWQRSFDFDKRLLTKEVEASSAHARALNEADVLSSDELISILEGLQKIGGLTGSDLEDAEAEDVHHFVEKQLVKLIGDPGYKLHSGRSRNEQIATDLRLYIRGAIDQLHHDLHALLEAIVIRAEKAGDAAMPAYTHLQRAEPVLVGHWLMAYHEMFLRDLDRLGDCRKRLNLCPLGSGAVAGTTLTLNRGAMASSLGFEGPTANSIDATSDRDFALEFVNSLTLLSLHLSRWAEEMILFSSQEYRFVVLPDAYSTGSSAMPQKKNGDLLELTRGKAARLIGNATSLMVTVKGLPLAYNKDLQETQQPVFEATETLLTLVPLVTGWMQAVEFNFDVMQNAVRTGFMNAFAAATYLTHRGVPFRLAHEQIGKAVAICLEKNCELEDLSLEELKQLSPAFDQDFYSSLTLQSVLAIHDVPGATAPAQVKQAIADAKRRLASLKEETHAHA